MPPGLLISATMTSVPQAVPVTGIQIPITGTSADFFLLSDSELALYRAIYGRSSEVEQFSEFSARVSASVVNFHQLLLLGIGEFRLFSTKPPFRLSNLHTLPSSRTNQIGLEFGDHRKNIEKQSPDRVVRIVHRPSDAELHVFRGQLIDDVFRISQRAGEPIKFRNNQCVSRSARC